MCCSVSLDPTSSDVGKTFLEKILALIATKEEIEQTKQQIMQLFAPDDKLFAAEVSIRLKNITGGRKVFNDSKVISFLEALVKEERLLKKEQEKIILNHKVNLRLYFLPKK